MSQKIKAWAIMNKKGWITGWQDSSLDIYETKRVAETYFDDDGDSIVPCGIIIKSAKNK